MREQAFLMKQLMMEMDVSYTCDKNEYERKSKMNETELKLEKIQKEIDDIEKKVEGLQAGSYVEETSSGWY